MSIKNHICENCSKYFVCKIADKLGVFALEGKKDLGVDITIDQCKEYNEVQGE